MLKVNAAAMRQAPQPGVGRISVPLFPFFLFASLFLIIDDQTVRYDGIIPGYTNWYPRGGDIAREIKGFSIAAWERYEFLRACLCILAKNGASGAARTLKDGKIAMVGRTARASVTET